MHRFDSNCYIAITRKLDTHDVSRQRPPLPSSSTATTTSSASLEKYYPTAVAAALAQITQPTLVIGIQSDGLFTYAEQQELAEFIPNARLKTIDSPEGHDAFLLQFEQVNAYILEFLGEVLPDIMTDGQERVDGGLNVEDSVVRNKGGGGVTGEVADITAW